MVNNGPTNINRIFVMAEIQRSTIRLCYIMIQIFEIQYDKNCKCLYPLAK